MKQDLQVIRTIFDINKNGIQTLQTTYQNSTAYVQELQSYIFTDILLPPSYIKLTWYSSSWGKEFTVRTKELTAPFRFKNEKGRCSGETTPFFTLSNNISSIDFAICTSGNYQVIFTPSPWGLQVVIADSNPCFSTLLHPGESFTFPKVLAHIYQSMEQCYKEKQLYRGASLPEHSVYKNMPIIYNHWWAYEDKHLSEQIILKNGDIASELGMEILVLDAGWFGNDSLEEDWLSVRGDWDRINHTRFPHGLTNLRDELQLRNLKLGIWCEIEAIGPNAKLAAKHPDFIAKRDYASLGYLCFGNPAVQQWAYQTLKNLFAQCGAVYWKMDFNLDPGMGCNCPDHGHSSNDGLNKHYKGLYWVLDRLREDYPDLIIENCSSGGQRFNLEMAEHTHIHFLSDPDYSTHQMRLFKEASKWLLPCEILHFMWSNTIDTNGSSPFESLNLDLLTKQEIQYHMRLAMMHQFGISHRLPEYQPETLKIVKAEISFYKNNIRPILVNGEYLPLYLHEEINIFSFRNKEDILIFLFAEKPGNITFKNSLIIPNKRYLIEDYDGGTSERKEGYELTKMSFSSDSPWKSALIHIKGL